MLTNISTRASISPQIVFASTFAFYLSFNILASFFGIWISFFQANLSLLVGTHPFAFIIVMIMFGPVLPSFMLSTLLFPLLHRNLVLVFANDLECLVLVQFLKYEFIQLSTTRVKEHLFPLYFFHPPI